jgi:hypothetical protein
LFRTGQLSLLRSLTNDIRRYHRLTFLASGLSSGLLHRLAAGPVPIDRLETEVGLRHVRSFLKPGGRLLVTTVCQGPGAAVDVLNIWGAMTEGCGRLPSPDELVGQFQQAGYVNVQRTRLVPGESFYSFLGQRGDTG